jgi:hypothetical protein
MTTPFSSDRGSIADNASTDFSFNDDKIIANKHLVSFMQAMDAPAAGLGEVDYRYPDAKLNAPAPNVEFDDQVKPYDSGRDGQFPCPFAP